MPPASHFEDDKQGIAAVCQLFRESFQCDPTTASAAPGRVNLIGEHVDYNDGFVFPFALEKNTYMAARLIEGDENEQCEIVSSAYPGEVAKFTSLDEPLPADVPKWASYVKGMLAIYKRNGHQVPKSFQAAIVSSVPQGGGLSSSAALEMATGIIIENLMHLNVSGEERAKMGQKCEHEFAGVPCGIMDQLISSKAGRGKALLIDCRSLNIQSIPLNHPQMALVVANSKVVHQLSGTEYPLRRQQCYEIRDLIKDYFPNENVKHLRDCNIDMLNEMINNRENVNEEAIMRAKHVINEDQRTLKAADALKLGDLVLVGKLMYESHVSLRDLFQVSTKEIDALVEIAMSVDGVYGSRITGGGFGGCTVTLVRKDCVDHLISEIHAKYPQHNNGIRAEIFSTNAGVGARDLSHFLSS